MGDFGYEYDDEDEQQGQGDGPADLRKAHRTAVKELKALKATLTERDARIAELSKRVRNLDIVDLLPKGVSPKVAKLIPETVEPTADAVKAWLDEFGDVFNIKTDESTTDVVTDSDGDGESGDDTPRFDENTLAALAAMQQVSAGGSAIPADALGALRKAASADVQNPEEGLALLKSLGIETVSGY